MSKPDFDAVVVGAGPNGLAAAIALQREGLSVLLVEGKHTVGGGMRSQELTLPGFVHDICSAIHPMAALSPFFKSLPLDQFGLKYIYPTLALAHPFDDGTAAVLYSTVEETAKSLQNDAKSYTDLVNPLLEQWPRIDADVLAPLHFPRHPLAMAKFGLKAFQSANGLSKRFQTKKARGLWAGLAAHSMLPFSKTASSAIGLVLLTAAHMRGWPLPEGGTQNIANALADYFISLGGKIEIDFYVDSIEKLPSARALLFDVSPKQLLEIAGDKFSSSYKSQLKKYRYGMGVFKMDWALDGPIPFTSEECRQAGTVHIGNELEEIAVSEQQAWDGKTSDRPFVLLAQQSLFDSSRAPAGKHTAWAYCHVPNSSTKDMTDIIEKQVERFAPGFRDRILARHSFNPMQLENYNPNYIGGDINGGSIDIGQLFARPVWKSSPYRTSATGIYICSASSPPGGGVHGMCGYNAAKRALKDVFNIER